MKKIIFTFIALCAFGFTNAQSRENGAIELVPQIGFSSANYYGDGIGSGNSALASVTFGVGTDYFFNNRWSLHSGLLFQTMGTEITNLNLKEKLDYVTIPVNASWHFGSTRKWNLNFGPSVSFLTSAKIGDIDVKDVVNSTQIGLSVGIGYKIEVSEKVSILIDYQSLSGLNNVSKDSNLTFKNTFGSFNVGGVFKL